MAANETRTRRLHRELQQLKTNPLPGINVNEDISTSSLETYVIQNNVQWCMSKYKSKILICLQAEVLVSSAVAIFLHVNSLVYRQTPCFLTVEKTAWLFWYAL